MTSSVSLLLPGKCKVKRFYKRVCLPISLLACLGQATFAQCRHSTTLTETRELEDRIVVLTLKLSKRGAVRDVSVLEGPEALRARAIKAAKARKYKDQIPGLTLAR